jgi:hypothetical protein
MEDVVKRLLFFALGTLLLVPSAFGHDAGENPLFLGPGKWAEGRENWGIPLQPQVAASPVCHNVKRRVETPKGHFVYRTHQICAPGARSD